MPDTTTTPDQPGILPVECELLDAAWRKSGMTAADLATATGISLAAVRIALTGVRYREGKPRRVVPPDPTLAKLAAALGIAPETLSGIGRGRAASLLAEMQGATERTPPDLNTIAALAAREAVIRQLLAIATTEELHAEIERRSRA